MPSNKYESLIEKDIFRDPPLHPRRTLKQYYFPSRKDLSEQDRDQVVYRDTSRTVFPKPLVMVDQLWLWILDDSRQFLP